MEYHHRVGEGFSYFSNENELDGITGYSFCPGPC